MTTKDERTKAAATVELWRARPDSSGTATLGSAMLGGQWTTRYDAEAVGISTSVVGQVVAKLRAAGFRVESKPGGPSGLMAFRVAGKAEAAISNGNGGHGPTPTHPPVGAKVVVKAVAMGARGALVVHLSDGNGNAWAATITGYVDP